MKQRKQITVMLLVIVVAMAFISGTAFSADKPNIVIIWGDDIGQSNVSAYSRGMMGYHTPNIDRVAKEGMMFTDYYAEQSCTAGRSAFITGQSVFRTGLSKVGMPGADLGMRKEDPTIAELLKPHAGKEILVFHPAYGHFTKQYGLKQVPILIDGKEPSAKQLVEIIESAKASGFQIVFVQPQFSAKTASVIAEQVGAAVVEIDPLSQDYLSNLRKMAAAVEQSFHR